ncbi:MAG: hypothetical protein D6731_08160 [Planctomycetota bacterium]|nr:MAG: hypothetical protein D6731_08160 [Planctomycetota bacterium]
MTTGPEAPGSPQVEDRFLLRIAVKNRLLSPEQAERILAALESQPGLRAEDAILQAGFLDPRRLERLREAVVASQIVRLDTLYASVLLESGAVRREAIDAAFALQRQGRFRVRLGPILVERGVIGAREHHRTTTEVIRRLREQGEEAYASALGAMPSGSISAVEPVPPSQPSDLGSPPTDERTRAGSSGRGPLGVTQAEIPRIPLDDTHETDVPFARSAAFASRLEHLVADDDTDPFVLSAVRTGLDSREIQGFSASDAGLAAADLRASESLLSSPPAASSPLERVDLDTGSDADAFDPDAYLERKRRRTRRLLLGGGLLGGCLLVGGSTLGWVGYSNRTAVAVAQSLAERARAVSTPEARVRLYEEALSALDGAGRFGTDARRRAGLQADLRWGLLEARVEAALARGDVAAAEAALASSPGDDRPGKRGSLLREIERARTLHEADEAESRGQFGVAARALQRLLPLGDPGGELQRRLRGLRSRLLDRAEEAYRQALESLEEADERRYVAAAELVHELFREDTGLRGRLEELRFRRLLERGSRLLEEGRAQEAEPLLQRALAQRPADPTAETLLERARRQAAERDAERLGRAHEARGAFEEAIAAYREALSRADGPGRKRLRESIQRCAAALRERSRRRREERRIGEALALIRRSDLRGALSVLESLRRETGSARAQALVAAVRRLEGTVYVPPGPFLMGSSPGPGVKPIELPQRTVEVPGYFIDRTEVTNAAYARFLNERKLPPPPHWTYVVAGSDGSPTKSFPPEIGNHPVVNITWEEARAYARWRGGDLPTEAQWEKAARGTDGRTFPWGERVPVHAHVQAPPDPLRRHPTAPVGAHRDDVSPFGVRDMAGNVNEWTLDPLQPYPGAPSEAQRFARPDRRVVRGGAYRWPYADARCAARDSMRPTYRSPTVGFRVVFEVPSPLRSLR